MNRRRIRRQVPEKKRTRREVLTAAGAAAAVVAASAIAVWLMRPGGIADRQPRATWLVVLAALAAVLVAWFVLQTRDRRIAERRPAGLVAGVVLCAGGAVVAGFLWPGGLLRQYESGRTIDPSDLTVPTAPPTTAAEQPTTTAAAGSTTTAPPTTAAPTTTTGGQ